MASHINTVTLTFVKFFKFLMFFMFFILIVVFCLCCLCGSFSQDMWPTFLHSEILNALYIYLYVNIRLESFKEEKRFDILAIFIYTFKNNQINGDLPTYLIFVLICVTCLTCLRLVQRLGL